MTSVDAFLDRVYNERHYNCLHFTVEVWRALTGEDIAERLDGLLSGPVADRRIRRPHTGAFLSLPDRRSPCLALMQRARIAPHVGIYLRGRVLHIRETGPAFEPLEIATYGWKKVRFYL